VRFLEIAREAAPMLMPGRLTVNLTVKIADAACDAIRINDLESSLMIEWE